MEITAIYDNEFQIMRHFGDSQQKIKIGRNNQQQYFLLHFFSEIKENVLVQLQEIQQINHPSILKLLDIRINKSYQKRDGISEILSCLIYEYPRAGELYEYLIQTGHFHEQQARCYFKQILEGLIQIHKLGKYHGELLTENIFFADAKTIKIGELGRTLVSRRKYSFESPQWSKDNINNEQSKDIFALGMILFTFVFGGPPFQTVARNDNYYQVFIDDPEKFWTRFLKKTEVQDQISQIDDFKDLIHGMLTENPQTRYSLSEIYSHPWTNIPCEINELMIRHFNQRCQVVDSFLTLNILRNQIIQQEQRINNTQNQLHKGVGQFYRSIDHVKQELKPISQTSNRQLRKIDKDLVKVDGYLVLNDDPNLILDQIYNRIDNQNFSIKKISDQFFQIILIDQEEQKIKIELFQIDNDVLVISFKRLKGNLFQYIKYIKELHQTLNGIFEIDDPQAKLEQIQ